MKILMFCHHPDVLYYAHTAFKELGHTVYVADEELTAAIGFNYSSVKRNKFEVVNKLYDPEDLYPGINVTFARKEEGKRVDMLWSMLPEITSLHRDPNFSLQTWFDGQMQVYLRQEAYGHLPGIKSANHPDAWKLNRFHFLPNWVPPKPINQTVGKKTIQLITELDKVQETKQLIELKNKYKDEIGIYGGDRCPDGFIRDVDILPYTSLLVHNKTFGVNCYAVCKALDRGIPVYMSKTTKNMIGFDDLPDSLFYFSEEYTLEEAHNKAKEASVDTIKKISDTYRSIYTLERTVKAMEKILHDTK